LQVLPTGKKEVTAETGKLATYNLQAITASLKYTPANVDYALRRSRKQYNFPAQAQGKPLLVDEDLKIPVTLMTALRTAAMYASLDWEKPVNRRVQAVEFFRQYTQVLFPDLLNLAARSHYCPDPSLSNLVVNLHRGEPASVEIRRITGLTGPLHAAGSGIPGCERIFSLTPYLSRCATELLENNLRPLVKIISEEFSVKEDVLWDGAIEAMLEALEGLPTDIVIREPVRQAFLIQELDPGDRLAEPAYNSPNPTAPASVLPYYTRRRCCEKFRRGNRCLSCPGRSKV
jgi:hypothetical protein